MQIKNFIESKIKILEKKNIDDSKNVLNNRFQLEEEIKSFTEKINVLISKKIIYEFNRNEQQKYKEYIEKLSYKIKQNNLEKKTIQQNLKEINNALPYMKKIINSPIKTENNNMICEKCYSNYHQNCNCSFIIISKWICCMINFSGKCKICNHSYSDHKRGKFIFNQTEENEQLISSEIEEIKNYIKTLSEAKKSKKLLI